MDTQNLALEKAKEELKLGTISTTEFNRLQRNISYTEAEVSKLNNELEGTKTKISSLGSSKFERFSQIGSTLTKSVTLPIMGVVTAFGTLAKKSADTADALFDQSTKIGLSVEALQEWNHTATLMGVSTESMNKAFVKVNGILGDIATGESTKAVDSLKSIGLTIDDLKGKNTDAAFMTIRNALSNVADESIRVGVANEFFGEKIGSEVLPIINSEASAISNLREEARSLGIITTEQAQVTGSFNDTLDQVKQSLTSLGVELSVTLLPIMQSLLEKVRDNLIPTIKGWIDKWNNIDDSTKRMIITLGIVVAAIGPVLTIIGKVGPILKIVSASLKGIGTSGVIAGTGINFATLGIGALIALLATALMSSEKFRALLMKLGETLIRLLSPIMDVVGILIDALEPVLKIIIDLIVMLLEILMPILDIIIMPLITQFQLFASLLEMISPLLIIIAKVLQAVLVPALSLVQKILEPILNIIEKIVGLFSKIFGFVGSLASKIGELFGGGPFGDGYNLKQKESNVITNNNKNSSNTINNVTVNTTSSTFDIDSINKALGGSYI